MTSYVILDSGILLATVMNERYSEQAKRLLDSFKSKNLAAPTLLHYELVAVTRKWVYRELITTEKAEQMLNTLLGYSIELHFDAKLLKRAYELATKYNRPTAYDAQYLALAERLSCEFWTLDERLFNATKNDFQPIRWLGNWETE